MWSILQVGENEWQVLHDGEAVVLSVDTPNAATYAEALAYIAGHLAAQPLASEPGTDPSAGDGLLPETWADAGGIFFSEPTGDGRDFTKCQWTWRDPETVPVPLMLQTCTDIGHFGAELAGFVQQISLADGTGHASGRFYDTEKGNEARTLLLGGRKFGVSVDPGAVDATFACTEEDDDGWCLEERIDFLAYEVIGITMTPFAGFQNAAITLSGGETLTAAAVPFADLPLSEQAAPWDEAAAATAVKALCSSDGSGNPDTIDWEEYAEAFLWADPENLQSFDGYQLQIAGVDADALLANWSAITAAADAVNADGAGLPAEDIDGVKAVIGAYYDKAADQYGDDTIVEPWGDDAGNTTPGEADDASAAAQMAMMEAVTDHEFVDENGDGFCDSCTNEGVNGECQQICGATEDMHDYVAADDGQGGGADGEGNMAAGAALTIPDRPPVSWFEIPEPEMGATGMREVYGMDASELLVTQPDGQPAVPLQILDDGRVYGHIARWGERHIGFPGRVVTPPQSETAYAHFHVGQVVCEGGERVATGTMTVGSEHAPLQGLSAAEARDFYAHSGMGWANVRMTNGHYGVWVSGTLRPDVSPSLVRVLRSLAPSGDWRRIGRSLETVGVLMVNVPGFPITRDVVVASGLEELADAPMVAGAMAEGETVALVAAGMVYRCAECAKRASRNQPPPVPEVPELVARELSKMRDQLGVIERRTRHLRVAEVSDLRQRISAN